jgi:hypothetical protein
MLVKTKSPFSTKEPLNVKLSRCGINFRLQVSEGGGWHHKNWDPNSSFLQRAITCDCGFTNKDADDIAELFGLKHLEPEIRYLFVLQLAMFFAPWTP